MLGRPTDYTEELADYICEQIATSTKSVRALALSDDRLPKEEIFIIGCIDIQNSD